MTTSAWLQEFAAKQRRDAARQAMQSDLETLQPSLFITIQFNETLTINSFVPTRPRHHQDECVWRAAEERAKASRRPGGPLAAQLPQCTCRYIGKDTHHRLHRYMAQRQKIVFGQGYWQKDCGFWVAFLQGDGVGSAHHWHVLWRLPDSVRNWDMVRLRFAEPDSAKIIKRACELYGSYIPLREPKGYRQRRNKWVPQGSIIVDDLRHNTDFFKVVNYVLDEYDVDLPDRIVLSSDFSKKGSNPSGNPQN